MLENFDLDRTNLSLERMKAMATDQVMSEIRRVSGTRLAAELVEYAYYRQVQLLADEVRVALAEAEALATAKKIVFDAAAAAKADADKQLRQLQAARLMAETGAERLAISDSTGTAEKAATNRDGEWRLARIEYNQAESHRAKLASLAAALVEIPEPATPLLQPFLEKILA